MEEKMHEPSVRTKLLSVIALSLPRVPEIKKFMTNSKFHFVKKLKYK